MTTARQISSAEWRWAGGWSALILALSCVPYLIAAQLAPPGWEFAGFMVNPLDGQSYMAKMQQGFAGNWLFHLTYTPEPHDGAFIFTFYLALGHLAALTGLPMIWVFHLARLLAGLVLLGVAYRFVAHITPDLSERRLAFVLLLTSSGLGWLGAMTGAFPIDLWVPEAFVPYSLYANPHFPLSMALMLIIFQRVIWPPQTKSGIEKISNIKPLLPTSYSLLPTPYSLLPGLAALALALILPFALLTVWAVLGVFLLGLYLARRRLPWLQIWPTLGVILFGAPVIAYDYWVSISNPILAGWSAQNITPAPAPANLLLGYGLVGALSVVGGLRVARRASPLEKQGEWLALGWALTTIVLLYLPLDLQRRLINGLHIPLCILAAIGLKRGLAGASLRAGYQRLATQAVIILSALGTVFVWTVPLLGMLSPPDQSATTALFFLRQEEIIGLNWLRENTSPDDIILASPRLGMFVPGQTGARAFYGHPFETIDAEAKKAMAEAFYRGERESVSPSPDFVVYGPAEQALGQPLSLFDYPQVFNRANISIYKLTK
ncbi:MAG: hypothetical protein AB1801_19675 [Chloroflexota bacterium]